MPGAYTDQLLTTLVRAAGTLVAKIGGAVGGSLNFLAPLTATWNASAQTLDIGIAQQTLPPCVSTIGFPFLSNISGINDHPVSPLFRNSTGAGVTIMGADLWPATNLTHDATNYETISLLLYASTTLTGSPTVLGQISTVAGDWTAHTPISFATGIVTIPNGYTLAFNIGHTNTGQALPTIAIWMR